MLVYSHPGQGSIFTAYLPVEAVGTCPLPSARAEIRFRGRGETILVVER